MSSTDSTATPAFNCADALNKTQFYTSTILEGADIMNRIVSLILSITEQKNAVTITTLRKRNDDEKE